VLLTDITVSVEPETVKVYAESIPIPTQEEESSQLNDTQKIHGRILALSQQTKFHLFNIFAERNYPDCPTAKSYHKPDSCDEYVVEIEALSGYIWF
jgi:hypothetical protein